MGIRTGTIVKRKKAPQLVGQVLRSVGRMEWEIEFTTDDGKKLRETLKSQMVTIERDTTTEPAPARPTRRRTTRQVLTPDDSESESESGIEVILEESEEARLLRIARELDGDLSFPDPDDDSHSSSLSIVNEDAVIEEGSTGSIHEDEIMEDVGEFLRDDFVTDLEPKEKHAQKMMVYQYEKAKLLAENWAVTKTANETRKIEVGAIVQTRKAPRRQGEVICKRESDKKWIVRPFDGGDPIEGVGQCFRLVTTGLENRKYKWTITESSSPEEDKETTEYAIVGVAGFDFDKFLPSKVNIKNPAYAYPYLQLLKHLWPGDYKAQLNQMNNWIAKHNQNNNGKNKIKTVTENQWWTFIGILIAAGPLGKGGVRLWESEGSRTERTFSDPINLGPKGKGIMSFDRFKHIKKAFPHAFCDLEAEQRGDPWAMIGLLVRGFNENRSKLVAASVDKVLDESMSAHQPRTTKTGVLPNLSFILRKPKPLGTEFKTVCDAATGIMLHLEIQRGKDGMKTMPHANKFQPTAACVVRLVEGTEHSGKNLEERRDAHGSMQITPEGVEVTFESDSSTSSNDFGGQNDAARKRERFSGDSWFSGVAVAEEMDRRGHDWGGPVKTNHRYVPKEEIEEKMKHWPSGSNLVMECTSPATGAKLVLVGYKYNSRKVLLFLFTKNYGTTESGKPYIAKFNDSFGNVAGREVDRPSNVSHYFRHSNKVDAHNQARQAELALEERWITFSGWFRCDTTIISMTATDCWNAFRFGVADTKQKAMTIGDFADRLACDCIYNQDSNEVANAFIRDDTAAAHPPIEVTVNGALYGGVAATSPLSNAMPSGSGSSSGKTSASSTVAAVLAEHAPMRILICQKPRIVRKGERVVAARSRPSGCVRTLCVVP